MQFHFPVIKILCIVCWMTAFLYGQGRPYEGPDDPAGDIAARRMGFMSGNRVTVSFHNTTELGNFPNGGSVWPNDENGLEMHSNIGLLIGARVFVINDTIPVTDLSQISNSDQIDTLYFLQTHFRRDMDVSSDGTVLAGFEPVFGYFNENSEYPAISNRPESWPPSGWPARGEELKWPGEWNGRFGRGVQYADLECYFVANDAQDQEYLQKDRRVKYYPRPGVWIGDKRPSVTIQKGNPWGGIGVRVQVRGFQWNNGQARDAIFWEYDISNISDYDLNNLAFGYYVDVSIGGEAPDNDLAFYNTTLDMAYAWDYDGIGTGGIRPGVMGIAFLESPGIPDDGVDNDEDGLIDEKRDNPAISVIGPMDGINDLEKFLSAYDLTEEELKSHWDADEDQDWDDGIDRNSNGIYEPDEYAGDDLGTDGVAPTDLNYTGPDWNGTECNHKPDFVEGIGCEPDFNATDVSESDMLGLTMFSMFPIEADPRLLFRYDDVYYHFMTTAGLNEYTGDITNVALVFASATFLLNRGRTERISMSELHSYESLSGLNSPDHPAPGLFERKRIVQLIYENDYRFAQPPRMPTLEATAGDGKVILSWDDAADKLTREPLLGNVNDFEGYKLYRATDKRFSDAEVLRDVYGNPAGKLPIFQCDLKNGIKGITDFGANYGLLYNLGDDTGIRHFFVDEEVLNGKTYYYGLAAYDYGIQSPGLSGVGPAENNLVINLDENENIIFIGRNVKIVTPYQAAADYLPPSVNFENTQTLGRGVDITPLVISDEALSSSQTYKIKFDVDTLGYLRSERYRHPADLLYLNSGFSVYEVNQTDSLIYHESPENFIWDNMQQDSEKDYWHFKTETPVETDIFNGIQLNIDFPYITGQFDPSGSGWLKGEALMNITPSQTESKYFPWSYDIIFTDNPEAYRTRINLAVNITGTEGQVLEKEDILLDQVFPFYVENKVFTDSGGACELMDMVVYDYNQNGVFDRDSDCVLVGPMVVSGRFTRWAGTVFSIDFHDIEEPSGMPEPGDIYHVDFMRPFVKEDSIVFTVQPSEKASDAWIEWHMDKIKVVPNPYVATNAMEPAQFNPFINQRRQILFTHIPSDCSIKIFTSSGVFVDEIIVDNPPPNGTAHWDLLTKEGLEIAAGIYIFHVKDTKTGKEKLGKFAVIK